MQARHASSFRTFTSLYPRAPSCLRMMRHMTRPAGRHLAAPPAPEQVLVGSKPRSRLTRLNKTSTPTAGRHAGWQGRRFRHSRRGGRRTRRLRPYAGVGVVCSPPATFEGLCPRCCDEAPRRGMWVRCEAPPRQSRNAQPDNALSLTTGARRGGMGPSPSLRNVRDSLSRPSGCLGRRLGGSKSFSLTISFHCNSASGGGVCPFVDTSTNSHSARNTLLHTLACLSGEEEGGRRNFDRRNPMTALGCLASKCRELW